MLGDEARIISGSKTKLMAFDAGFDRKGMLHCNWLVAEGRLSYLRELSLHATLLCTECMRAGKATTPRYVFLCMGPCHPAQRLLIWSPVSDCLSTQVRSITSPRPRCPARPRRACVLASCTGVRLIPTTGRSYQCISEVGRRDDHGAMDWVFG